MVLIKKELLQDDQIKDSQNNDLDEPLVTVIQGNNPVDKAMLELIKENNPKTFDLVHSQLEQDPSILLGYDSPEENFENTSFDTSKSEGVFESSVCEVIGQRTHQEDALVFHSGLDEIEDPIQFFESKAEEMIESNKDNENGSTGVFCYFNDKKDEITVTNIGDSGFLIGVQDKKGNCRIILLNEYHNLKYSKTRKEIVANNPPTDWERAGFWSEMNTSDEEDRKTLRDTILDEESVFKDDILMRNILEEELNLKEKVDNSQESQELKNKRNQVREIIINTAWSYNLVWSDNNNDLRLSGSGLNMGRAIGDSGSELLIRKADSHTFNLNDLIYAAFGDKSIKIEDCDFVLLGNCDGITGHAKDDEDTYDQDENFDKKASYNPDGTVTYENPKKGSSENRKLSNIIQKFLEHPILSKHKEKLATYLVLNALYGGSDDNITAAVVYFSGQSLKNSKKAKKGFCIAVFDGHSVGEEGRGVDVAINCMEILSEGLKQFKTRELVVEKEKEIIRRESVDKEEEVLRRGSIAVRDYEKEREELKELLATKETFDLKARKSKLKQTAQNKLHTQLLPEKQKITTEKSPTKEKELSQEEKLTSLLNKKLEEKNGKAQLEKEGFLITVGSSIELKIPSKNNNIIILFTYSEKTKICEFSGVFKITGVNQSREKIIDKKLYEKSLKKASKILELKSKPSKLVKAKEVKRGFEVKLQGGPFRKR